MLQLTYPGVYTQELPSGAHALAGAPTSVALFIGPTRTGIDNRPIRVQSFADFERSFGGLIGTSALCYSVLHFFANGGGEAQVIRVPVEGAGAAKTAFIRDASPAALSLTVEALSSGAASNEIYVEFDPFGIGAAPFTPQADKTRFNLTVTDRVTGRSERFAMLSTAAGTRLASTVVNDKGSGSALVTVTVDPAARGQPGPVGTGSVYTIGTAPAAGSFAKDIKCFLDVSIRDAAGAVDAVNKITDLPVSIFATGSAKPVSVLELATRLQQAINAAIRADANALSLMEGYGIEVAPLEGGTILRLRVSPLLATAPQRRIPEAVVTIKAPTAAAGTESLLATYTLSEVLARPARYRLGAPYTGTGTEISGAPVPGAPGQSHGQPKTDDIKAAVMALATPDPFFNTLCIPDLVQSSVSDPMVPHHAAAMSVYSEAAAVCEAKHAFLLVDPPPNAASAGAAEAWKSLGFSFRSTHAAAFFPAIRVDDPLLPGAIRAHPPSGAIAGLIARTDNRAGVWQAPAGTDASLNGVYGPAVVLSDAEHGVLNPIGLNVIRQFPIFGTVNFAARTLEGADAMASEWKYIPVRRTANHILRSLSEGLRWAIHKPNGEALWAELRLAVTAFMQGLYRQGAFKGASPREAYFVSCDSTTNPADQIDLGIVNVLVGFAPLKPAEFVVISLRQIVQGNR